MTIKGKGRVKSDYLNYSEHDTGRNLVNTLIINNGATYIDGPFYKFPNLTKVVIPSSITAIWNAFTNCRRLKTVDFYLEDLNNNLVIGENAFQGCISIKEILFPATQSIRIGKEAFQGCSSLQTVTFLSSELSKIGSSAFSGCVQLSTIELPSGIDAIPQYLFYRCYHLKTFVIPSGVNTIHASAFRDCTSLTSITIPASVTRINTNAFLNCKSLKDIYYGGSSSDWKRIVFGTSNECLLNANIHFSN